MKRLLLAALALSVLGATAATAAPWHHHHRDGFVRHEVLIRPAPRPHVWVRGERFAPVYGRPVIVRDWHRYHLRRPPYGYHWVRYDDRYLLVALSTGLIADIIANGYGY